MRVSFLKEQQPATSITMQRLHPRQLSSPSETPSITPSSTPSSDSTSTVAVPVLSAVGGTIFIMLCLASFVTYQVRGIGRYRADQARMKALAQANLNLDNTNSNNSNNNNYDPTTYLEEKGGPPVRSGAVQFSDNSQTLLFQSILPSSSSPSAPFPPPGYTARSPQSIVVGIDQIEKKAVAVALAGGNTSWRTEPWQQPKSRSPQDYLKQEQLERVMKLHRQQMGELQAMLQKHMLDNTQLLSPHAVVPISNGGDNSNMEGGGGGDEDEKKKRGWRIGKNWRSRLSFRSSRHHSSQIRGGGRVVSQSPQGIDSPMVQPDDVVRGPEAIIIPYPPPPPPPRLNTSLQVLGRPSHVTSDGMSSRGSDWLFESPRSELSMTISEELRPEERSMLVDCFEKINAHYERQFQIAESEILHGFSSVDDIDNNDNDNADADVDEDDDPDRIESAKSGK